MIHADVVVNQSYRKRTFMSAPLFAIVLLTLRQLDGSWSVPVCLREQAPAIFYELRAPNKVFFRLVFPTGGFRQGWGALGFRRTECVAGSGASCMANADYIVFIASAPNAFAFYSTSPTAANGAPTAAALTFTLDYVNQCCVNGITKEIEFVRSTDAFGGGVPLNTAGRQTLLWAYSTSAADPAVFSQHAATTRGAISFDWRGTGLCYTAPPTVPPATTRPTSTTTTTTTTTILTTTMTAPAATTVCTACDVNFGIPGTSTWCGCCFNNCGGNRAACVNNGFCSSRCREARYGCAATTVPSVGTPVPAAALRACDFKRDECWKKCGSSKYFAFECEHEVNSFDTVVMQCTVPSGCNCAPCQQLNCNECSWQDPSFSNTLGWCNCCASNCNGFLAACEAGNVFCKTACSAHSLCKPEDNPVNRLGITQAPTLPPPTTPPTTTPRPPTAPLTPVPSGVCATCAANFGAPNSQQWCNCCKNDCQGSRSNCESLSGWCVDKCRQYPDVCAPTPATVPPTPAPTEAPTPLPTPLPTPPVAPEVFRSSVLPVPTSTLTALPTMFMPPTVTTAVTTAFYALESDDGALVGGIVGGVVAVVLLLAVVAGLLLWRLKRAGKPENSDVALKPANHNIPHAAEFKVEEGPRYDSLSTDEAGMTLPADDRRRGYEAAPATSLRKAKANPSDSVPRKSKSTDTESNPSHLSGLSGRSSKVGSEFSSARAETWVIDASDLELGSVIGQGAFGVVRRAEWRGRTVAVKQIKKSTIGDDKAVADFEEEIGRMAALPMHENVVRLFGVVQLADGDVGAVVEFCAQGALVDALYGEKARDLSPDELLQIAYDAACGVMHLHANKIVHRDIAARNVLLAGKKDLVAKVSDFGMARNVESVYSGVASEQHTAATIGPVKWMAPEQLERMAYSRASDVFAFGVLLYEIFARSTPWPGLANVNVVLRVSKGERMELPKSVPAAVRKTMKQCWAHEAKERPKMSAVVDELRAALEKTATKEHADV
jgi:hypothetical protein